MIPRKSYESAIEKALKRSPVVSLLGPRQCGKTTLARMIEKKHGAVFFDLESPRDRLRLQNPQMALEILKGLVVIRVLPLQDVYFWSTYSGAELDLFFFHDSKRYGIEIKFSETPKMTKSMHIAIQDLDLQHLWVVYSGNHIVPLEKKITLVPLGKIETVQGVV